MSKPSLRERLAYAFDNSLARGPIVIIAYLALLSIALIVVLATLVWVTGRRAGGREAGTSPASSASPGWRSCARSTPAPWGATPAAGRSCSRCWR